MTSYLSLASIRRMTYAELERWWEVDFDALVSTVVAEATGPIHFSVREALASEDWVEQWADALFSGAATLLSDVERMEYLQDSRFEATRKRCAHVMARMDYVNRLAREKLRAQGREIAPENRKSVYSAAQAIFRKFYRDEFMQLREDELTQRGLPVEHSLHSVNYTDAYDHIEDATVQGLISAPVTSEIKKVMLLSDRSFRNLVADDVVRQAERCDALRHPLLLRKWSMALNELLVHACELNSMAPSFTLNLPRLDFQALSEEEEEDAWKILNRRRFIRSLAQRNRECKLYKVQLVRAASVRQEEILRPWRDASSAASEELVQRHPEEFAALAKELKPYCKPGSTEARDDIDRKEWSLLVSGLRQRLEDGVLLA